MISPNGIFIIIIPSLRECRGRGGRKNVEQKIGEYCEMLPSGHDMATVLMECKNQKMGEHCEKLSSGHNSAIVPMNSLAQD